MRNFLLFIFSLSNFFMWSQTAFYTEDFQAGGIGWNLNAVTGQEGADPNFFTISDNEGGVLPPGCGVAGNGDKTLHITSVFNPTGGASYDAGGLCGLLFCPQTNRRAESPVINCSGQSNITMSFDFISVGQGLTDNGSVWYFDGTNWSSINNSIKSTTCSNGQGQWTNLSVNLPSSANNNPSVKIGFKWVNNDDGVGTDPSLAVNNIKLTSAGPPALVVSLASSNGVSCFGQNNGSASVTINGGTLPYSIDWTPGNPTGDGTTTVSGLSAGNYVCTVTDFNGVIDTVSVFIQSPSQVIYNQSINVCFGQSYSIGNNTYSVSGNYSDTLVSASGCDSIVLTNLVVGSPVNTNVTLAGSTLLAAQAGASYQWLNCSNGGILIPNANNQFYTPTVSAGYAVIVTLNGCSDTSACFDVTVVGIEEQTVFNHVVFPNPSRNEFHFQFTELSPETIQILNENGKVISNMNIPDKSNAFSLKLTDLPTGIYFYRVVYSSGKFEKGTLLKVD